MKTPRRKEGYKSTKTRKKDKKVQAGELSTNCGSNPESLRVRSRRDAGGISSDEDANGVQSCLLTPLVLWMALSFDLYNPLEMFAQMDIPE